MSLDAAVDRACALIAPAWPLDRLIAVNPYWGFVNRDIERAAADLATLAGTTMTMPREWYRAHWRKGTFGPRHVSQAIAERGGAVSTEDVIRSLESPAPRPRRRPLLTDLADAVRSRQTVTATSWTAFVTRHLSQACAAHFDEGQASFGPVRDGGLFGVWRRLAERDASPRLLLDFSGFGDAVASLPVSPRDVIDAACRSLELPAPMREDYFAALLMSVGGWAAACAFRRWEARLRGTDDDTIVHLLAARLVWEQLIAGRDETLRRAWSAARDAWAREAPDDREVAMRARRPEWTLQRSVEVAYQEELTAALRPPRDASPQAETAVKAVFCIDVRSEVLRRALESTGADLTTAGFAGFFGLGLAYEPLVGPARPQLPGLLAPALRVRDTGALAASAAEEGARAADLRGALASLARGAVSSLPFVEIAGIGALPALLTDSLGLRGATADAAQPEPRWDLRPRLVEVEAERRAELAEGVLRGMSMTRSFPRLVAFIGHGASAANNPLLAGLHCGACGGQTGEINGRVLAALLNDASVREALAPRGIEIPSTTWFVPGLHDTTTDEVTLFDEDLVPATHRADLDAFRQRLGRAGDLARGERAPRLGVETSDPAARTASMRARARDWSEVRPEWGLARNAALLVAPRTRTREVDLDGRAFLHDYVWEEDQGFRVLETIMTAPMVVTHWINMQYYASTVDNARYGSGNKVLHNVVGGRVGVFEGAGGDLRIGLPMQSLHDGRDWVHVPLRLSVFIEAPEEAIRSVLATRHGAQPGGERVAVPVPDSAGRIRIARRSAGNVDAEHATAAGSERRPRTAVAHGRSVVDEDAAPGGQRDVAGGGVRGSGRARGDHHHGAHRRVVGVGDGESLEAPASGVAVLVHVLGEVSRIGAGHVGRVAGVVDEAIAGGGQIAPHVLEAAAP